MLTTLPLECFVCREVIINYYYAGKPFDMTRHLVLSTSHVVAAVGISLLVCDLGTVLEVIGATSACALAYILPPLCYIKLSTRSWRTGVAVACIAFGCTVLIISLILATSKIVRGKIIISYEVRRVTYTNSGEGSSKSCS